MSLVRAALHARPRPAASLFLQRRQASSVSHTHEEHHDEHHDSDDTQYGKEGTHHPCLTCTTCPTPIAGFHSFCLHYYCCYISLAGFATPFWRNTVMLSVLAVGFYKFAPAPGDDVYLTRYIAQFQTPQEVWAAINEKHVMDVTVAGEELLLQQSATRPRAHRYRYPQ